MIDDRGFQGPGSRFKVSNKPELQLLLLFTLGVEEQRLVLMLLLLLLKLYRFNLDR